MAVDSGKVANASLVSLFDVVENNAQGLKSKMRGKPRAYLDFDRFISSDIDIVVEAASQEAVRKFGKMILRAGKDLMVMSVGALADVAAFEVDAALLGRRFADLRRVSYFRG